MFSKVTITNYRGIQKLALPDLRQVNLLVGKNNCGKTSILETLFLLSNPGNAPLAVLVNNFRYFVIANENGWSVIFNNLDVGRPIELSAERSTPREVRQMTIRPHRRSDVLSALKPSAEGILTQQMKGNFSGSEAELTGLDIDFSISEPGAGKTAQKYSSNVQFAGPAPMGPAGLQPPPLSNHIPPNYKETMRAVFLTSASIMGGMNLRFNKLQIEKRVGKVVDILKRIEPKLTGLSLGTDGIVYADIGFPKLVPINMMGEGMVRLLAFILAISDAQNGVALIDEVENGFHISSHEALWDAILDSANDFGAQIVMTTHSMECVRSFNAACERRSVSNDDMRLFRLEKNADERKVVTYDRKTLTTALQSDWEVR
jgi:energy-coupling factor transporter ATP-binding protein EcfA2